MLCEQLDIVEILSDILKLNKEKERARDFSSSFLLYNLFYDDIISKL